MSLRKLAIAATAASTLVLAPLPAYAETVTTDDAAHDVVSQGLSDDEATDPEPYRVEGDALSMKVLHGPHNVRVNLHSATLTRTKDLDAVHVLSFRTNQGRRAELSLYVTQGDWQGQRSWTVNDKTRACRGLHTYISYGTGTVRVVVPRRCLSYPSWVRVGGGVGSREGSKLYADDVSLDGRVGHEPRLGPRVHRG